MRCASHHWTIFDLEWNCLTIFFNGQATGFQAKPNGNAHAEPVQARQGILDSHQSCYPRYAWTAQNSEFRTHPVAQLLPNQYGVFDMLGNGMEWCLDNRQTYPWPSWEWQEDLANSFRKIEYHDRRASRGGAILYQPLDARSAQRNDHPAGESRVYLTFRIARTIKKDSFEK